MKEKLKIRHYVMGLIFEAGNSSVMLPSSRELAIKFNLARSWVSLSLKEMVDEGYIFAKHGIGYFTNPSISFTGCYHHPALIGILLGDGRNYLHTPSSWSMLAPLGEELLKGGCYFRLLGLDSADDENRYDEVMSQKMDGLIWVDYPQLSESLAIRLSREIPIVCDNYDFSAINVVSSDISNALSSIATRLKQERKTRFLVQNPQKWNYELRAISSEFETAGIDFEVKEIATNSASASQEMLDLFASNQYDVLFTPSDRMFFAQYKQVHPDIKTEILYHLASRHISDYDFEEFIVPYQEKAVLLVRRLQEVKAGCRDIKRYELSLRKKTVTISI